MGLAICRFGWYNINGRDNMKRIILFDFFGVICSEIAPIWFRRYFNEEDAARIKHEIVAPGDLGQRSEDEIFRLAADACGVSAERVKADWYELAVINRELVEFIEKAKTKHPVYLLSNAPGTFLKTIIYKNDIAHLFDKMFISSEVGLAKPDVEYFRHCLSSIGAQGSECVMIDDNPANIKAAEEAGITGIVFRGNEDFYREFKKHFH